MGLDRKVLSSEWKNTLEGIMTIFMNSDFDARLVFSIEDVDFDESIVSSIGSYGFSALSRAISINH